MMIQSLARNSQSSLQKWTSRPLASTCYHPVVSKSTSPGKNDPYLNNAKLSGTQKTTNNKQTYLAWKQAIKKPFEISSLGVHALIISIL
ncbi:hypothetical protein Y032_0028g1754 [Ancylostoma ceylanicum]|uniref:Uncharacterized protein n=1 Tax=Ancylostoma ceylanicum TaxID=53326 RepID=A0A016US37_9BILA|nr:hypothetical protein Y032_0028g1754 [Ancylostoma ceylanicum]